jgi:pimeloyl-ACP methyl ester carboxylesterase
MAASKSPLAIDLYSPERDKYKSPLILIHGAWSSSTCWMPWATHFANLGWECRALNLRGRFGDDAGGDLKRLTFDDCVSDVKEVVQAVSFPPVVIAHDLGALIALKALEAEKASALILLAPLPPQGVMPELPRALKLLRLKYRPLLFLRRPFRIEESDFRRLWLSASSEDGAGAECLVAEAPALINEFFARRADFAPPRFPVLVASASEDAIAPAAALHDFAGRLGAEFREVPGGHWLIGEERGEETARDLHRWIMQKAGAEILREELPPAAAQ